MKTIIDTLKEPVNVLNATTFGVSLTTLPEDLKIVFYIVSIIASILVSIKYFYEIISLRKNAKKDI
jgi:hypothetical protein